MLEPPPKYVVLRPPPVTDPPKISSGSVSTAAAIRKATRPVITAILTWARLKRESPAAEAPFSDFGRLFEPLE